jgi:hypothetical protein
VTLPATLPAHICRKIKIDEHNCWQWLGYAVPARQRRHIKYTTRLEVVPEKWLDYEQPRLPRQSHEGLPKPANRVVASFVLGIPYRLLPRLSNQCGNAMCVNPHHHTIGLNPISRPFAGLIDRPLEVSTASTPEQIMVLLKDKEPMAELGPLNAAEEIGVSAIPDNVWLEYAAL